jgi:beta-phosphoglucomutase-like phosphatase (HAD superfamily)
VKVRAICFDLDNTLWDVWPVIMRAEQRMYEFLAERYPRVVANMTMEMMRAAREQTAAAHPQMRHDFTFLRKQTLREHAKEFGYAEAMAEEAFEAFIQARNEVDLYPDVVPALEQLRARYRLFTASNGNADLGKIGLGHFFERTINARLVGALKPDPRDLPQGDRGHRPAGARSRVRRRRSAAGRRRRARSRNACDLDRPPGQRMAGANRAGGAYGAVTDRARRAVVSLAYTGTYTRLKPDCLAKSFGVHSAPFVVPLPAFFSGLASRVIEDPSLRPTSEKSDETANVRSGSQPLSVVGARGRPGGARL